MTTYMGVLERNYCYYHMGEDQFILGNILFASDCTLRTTDGIRSDIIAGSAASDGYAKGVGQLREDKVVIADMNDHRLPQMKHQHSLDNAPIKVGILWLIIRRKPTNHNVIPS